MGNTCSYFNSRIFTMGSACCRVLRVAESNETITGGRYQTQFRFSGVLKEKRAHYHSKHDEIILLHNNARPQVAVSVRTFFETFNWEGIPPPPPYSLDIAPSNYLLFRLMAHGLSQ
ncbi:mariner Mos1 transposase [Trichonephila clavipes]|uniref:Mariner Mos1 transposase n=1 Tax=Trichonephila clavipes TaxID=2585209 RepID=A0A8X6RT10_TRICX|nr:mariner Mos1 transposase [Trichonephila clavipes]